MLTTWVAVSLACAGQVGTPAPFEAPNAAPLADAYGQYGFEGQNEQRFPYDTQQNWVHSYYQEMPTYGGHAFFRPYNYKDLLSQSQVSAGWGHSPQLPYSQQFWHRYHDQATLLKLSGSPAAPVGPNLGYYLPQGPALTAGPVAPAPMYYTVPQQPNYGSYDAMTMPQQVQPVAPAGYAPETMPAMPVQQPLQAPLAYPVPNVGSGAGVGLGLNGPVR